MTDDIFMAAALEQARQGQTMFGAVLVYGDNVVAKACNTVGATSDPSAHAELNLIRQYCQHTRRLSLEGHTLYTTAEPCPMCAGLCAFVALERVVYGVGIQDLAGLGVPQALVACERILQASPHPIGLSTGILYDCCLAHCRSLATLGAQSKNA